MSKKFFLFLPLVCIFFITFFNFFQTQDSVDILSPLVTTSNPESYLSTKYTPYSFEALSNKEFSQGQIKIGALTRKKTEYSTYIFTYQCDGKTISGMANIPNKAGKYPVIVLLRGYADKKNYYIGLGTEKSANFLAEHGFITLSPDFLGYGYSDWEDQDILLARFYRPVEVLNLLASIPSLPQADPEKIGLWGHSNGGQIALSILEITRKPYPTSLWAPVSLGFPDSILVYLGSQEVGNPVKEKIDEFLKENDPKKFSITEYFNQITSPFIVHQGEEDEMIKKVWSQKLVDELREVGVPVEFYLYPEENHNFNRFKETGDLVRQRDLKFFERYLKK